MTLLLLIRHLLGRPPPLYPCLSDFFASEAILTCFLVVLPSDRVKIFVFLGVCSVFSAAKLRAALLFVFRGNFRHFSVYRKLQNCSFQECCLLGRLSKISKSALAAKNTPKPVYPYRPIPPPVAPVTVRPTTRHHTMLSSYVGGISVVRRLFRCYDRIWEL